MLAIPPFPVIYSRGTRKLSLEIWERRFPVDAIV